MIDSDKGRAEISRFAVDLVIRIALIAGVVWVSLVLLRPIMPLMAWAVILAVAVHPVFAILRRRLHRGLAATIVSLVLLALLLVPVVMLAISAIDTLEGYSKLLAEGGHLVPSPPESIREWPLIGQRLHDLWVSATEDVRPLLTGHVAQIASVGRWIGRLAAGVTLEILQFAAAIIVAGVLLAYAETLTEVVRGLADRVADARGREQHAEAGEHLRQ
ncbi:MAG TPA: AI-2E family transporter, partial [Reyranella sp.]|nr:AI-2E family transporter [Reyranella sp.]